jgi:hypothetical protein
MTPERRRKIEDLYDAALGYGAHDRPAFLDIACGHDAALRAEVESLACEQDPSLMSRSTSPSLR